MKLYNTLSGDVQEFVPAGDQVKMYVCGVTRTHLATWDTP